uniref:Reverse transcriptase domain-containing protein n=1 Tax=Oryzias latipes TaxID=8090 RepID=A0A3P9M210_ORYLA
MQMEIVLLSAGTTRRFCLQRGIRQGCPVSVYLFLLVAQVFCRYIKSSNIDGISIAGKNILISQLADDTTLFLKNSSQVPRVLQVIETFSKASGLYLNLKKCELFPLKQCALTSINSILVKDKVTYLGLQITKDQKQRELMNYNPMIAKAQNRFNRWLQRDLSLKGRALLAKAEGISRLVYIASSLSLDSKTAKMIDQILFNFLWRNRIYYVRKSVVINSSKNGGLDFLDFSTLNNVLKIKWLKNFLKSETSFWNFIPKYISDKLGGLPFLLFCNFKIEKIPLKLSNFHKQVLLTWTLIYKHNFSPHRYYIWNNADILHKNMIRKSIFLENWFEKNISLVTQLMNPQGNLMSYVEFLSTYSLHVSPAEFSLVTGAIPGGVRLLCSSSPSNTPCFPPKLTDLWCGKIFFSTSRNNQSIRSLFQNEIATKPFVISYWNSFGCRIQWEKVWSLPQKYFITNKIRAISFKILHKVYPVKQFFTKFKKDLDINCSFCHSSPETVPHLFWYCSFTQLFWKDVIHFIRTHLCVDYRLFYEHIIFGNFTQEKLNADKMYVVNLLIIMAKHFIHKCKYSNKKTVFYVFQKEMVLYVNSIKSSTNKKAVRTVETWSLLKL